MRIVVTGGDGFIARNLRVRLAELGHGDVVSITRADGLDGLRSALRSADFVYHLAGVNRPKTEVEFAEGNTTLTATLCAELRAAERPVPLVFASSTQVALENAYSRSKRAAEAEVTKYAADTGSPSVILRLTNVFGKWARPNYNSAVATFCHNIARGLPITIRDPAAPLRLLYIDDVLDTLVRLLEPATRPTGILDVGPVYETMVGEVASILHEFAASRRTRAIPRVGTGLMRTLYATYVSYLEPTGFAYELEPHADARGVFVEMLRTADSGQFSYFTAGPGVTRGGHYHHTKTEKFLVVKGSARFRFRHIITGETFQLAAGEEASRVVESVPGWAHDITNVGGDEMIVLLWTNEVFDPQKPDTISVRVQP